MLFDRIFAMKNVTTNSQMVTDVSVRFYKICSRILTKNAKKAGFAGQLSIMYHLDVKIYLSTVFWCPLNEKNA